MRRSPEGGGTPAAADLARIARHCWFYVGGEYVAEPDGTYLRGQMYVERFTPADRRHALPVVMIHGGAQTAANFVATADGRPGWLHDFLRAGYEVLLVDQPERGRSGHALPAGAPAPFFRYSAERIEAMFTAPERARLWPQAERHDQWPGSGVRGDPAFERFFASQVEQLADRDEIERLSRDGGVALLDAIGPSILLTHSQSGPIGWTVADARPGLVKAILAVEPNGPPFRDVKFLGPPDGGAPDWFDFEEGDARRWGLTRLPMTFDPPAETPADLAPVPLPPPAPDLAPGLQPSGSRRRLVNLAGVPILILTGEASYHAPYDHCTSAFLDWAGVPHEFVRLQDRGLPGNGHMMMLERNSREIAELMIGWLAERLYDAD